MIEEGTTAHKKLTNFVYICVHVSSKWLTFSVRDIE